VDGMYTLVLEFEVRAIQSLRYRFHTCLGLGYMMFRAQKYHGSAHSSVWTNLERFSAIQQYI